MSLFRVSHTRLRWPLSLSHCWSLIRPHPVRRGKGSVVASLPLSSLVTDPATSRPPGERECGGLSLSPLVTDSAASCPPGEREEVHRFSILRRRGSTSRSAVHAVLSDQAPARQGLRNLLADSARRRSPSYIPTTSRYPLRPCSTARLPTSPHVDLP